MTHNNRAKVVIIWSYGHLHGGIPDNVDISLDLRRLLADPAHVPGEELLDLTGLDKPVRDFVFNTPGATELLHDTARMARRILKRRPIVVLGVGCAGGRHRSVAMADALGRLFAREGYTVWTPHLHVHLPRVIKRPAPARRPRRRSTARPTGRRGRCAAGPV